MLVGGTKWGGCPADNRGIIPVKISADSVGRRAKFVARRATFAERHAPGLMTLMKPIGRLY